MASAGDFLEMHEMQAFYMLIVIIDVFSTLLESCLGNKQTSLVLRLFVSVGLLGQILKSFGVFTDFFLTIEILVTAIVFNKALFSHWGYMLDLFVTASQIWLRRAGYTRESRLLHILRFWRFVRLFNSLVSIEKDLHEETRVKLDSAMSDIAKLREEEGILRGEVAKEKEARDSIEDMLQAYKDEIDTLNEALKIAAMDIAEVAQGEEDFHPSDEEEEEAEEDDTSKFTHNDEEGTELGSKNDESFYSAVLTAGGGGRHVHASTAARRRSNKAEVMRAVLQDSSAASSLGIEGKESSAFIVHEDGTFERS